jgi:Fic family protein
VDGPRRDHLLYRPPAEIAARELWDRLANAPLGRDDLLAAAERLGGQPRLRTGVARTTPFASGDVLEYASPEQVPRRLERLIRKVNAANPKLHPLLHAVGIYMETLLIHPLPDGNGRLARLLFQVSLRQTVGLKAPILPLGPACAANRPALMAAYLAWYFDRDAEPLVDFVTAALEELVSLYVRTARPTPRPAHTER